MAIILGKKPIIETKEYEDYAVGLSLPIQISNVAFKQNYTEIEQLKTNIKNLLLTKRGERIMQPNFGSGLQELLFEFNDDALAEKIEDTVTSALENWLPYISVDQIDIGATDLDKDNNIVNVSIKFRVLGNPDLNTVTFNVGV